MYNLYLYEYKEEYGEGVTSVLYIADNDGNIVYVNMNDNGWKTWSGTLDRSDPNLTFERKVNRKELKDKFFIDNI